MIMMHICFCVKHKKTRDQIHHNEDHNYHTYDEISTLPYRAESNRRSSDIIDNQDQNMTHQHAAHISNEISVQPTDDNTYELNSDYFHNDLPQIEVYNVQRQQQHLSTSLVDTNLPYTDLLQVPTISSIENIVNCIEINEHAKLKHQVIKRVQIVVTLIVTLQILLW